MKKFTGLFLGVWLFVTQAEAAADDAMVKLRNFAGREVSLSAVQRDATLVAFWIAACVPCLEEMPLLDALYKKLGHDSHITIIGVNLDENQDLTAAKKILAARKPTYPMLRDPGRELVKKWFPAHPDQLALPTILVFDRSLHALYSQGFKPGTAAEDFIATWSARLDDTRSGKLREPLKRADTNATPDLTQVGLMIEKLIRSRHPELSDADVKTRVAAALKTLQDTGTLTFD